MKKNASQLRFLMIFVGLLPLPQVARGDERDTDLQSDGLASVRSLVDVRDGWLVEVYLNPPPAANSTTIRVSSTNSSGRADLALPVPLDKDASRNRTIRIPRSLAVLGEFVVIDIDFEVDTSWSGVIPYRMFFQNVRGALVQVSGDAYYDSFRISPGEQASELAGIGAILPPPPGQEGLLPWEDPEVSPETQDKLWQKYVEDNPDAARVPRSANHATRLIQSETSGCGNSIGSPLICIFSLVLLLLVRSRRQALAVLGAFIALVAVTAAASPASARSVSGFLSFYENRAYPGSTEPGSRRVTPGGSPSCLPTVPNCVYRPLSFIKIQLVDEVGHTWTSETDSDGYFFIDGILYSDPNGYTLKVIFERIFNPQEGKLTITMYDSIETPAAVVLKDFIKAPNAINNLGRVAITTDSAASPVGDLAAIWATESSALRWLKAEGESRQLKAFGSPAGSFDRILIRLKSEYPGPKGPKVHCATDTIRLDTYFARGDLPASIGAIYHGRAVGCAPVTSGDWNFPMYPKNPNPTDVDTIAYGPRTSESVAFSQGWSGLIRLLTYWDPQTVAQTTIKAASLGARLVCEPDGQSNCNTDPYPNSNSVASIQNNIWALWEVLDADTGDSDGLLVDSVDLNLPTMMNSLVANRLDPAAVFTPRTPQNSCGYNENCLNFGDACINELDNCFYGSPHRGNISDYVLRLLADTQNFSIVTSILSSKCLANTIDSTPGYCGAWRVNP